MKKAIISFLGILVSLIIVTSCDFDFKKKIKFVPEEGSFNNLVYYRVITSPTGYAEKKIDGAISTESIDYKIVKDVIEFNNDNTIKITSTENKYYELTEEDGMECYTTIDIPEETTRVVAGTYTLGKNSLIRLDFDEDIDEYFPSHEIWTYKFDDYILTFQAANSEEGFTQSFVSIDHN